MLLVKLGEFAAIITFQLKNGMNAQSNNSANKFSTARCLAESYYPQEQLLLLETAEAQTRKANELDEQRQPFAEFSAQTQSQVFSLLRM
jgi:hypothetical protein